MMNIDICLLFFRVLFSLGGFVSKYSGFIVVVYGVFRKEFVIMRRVVKGEGKFFCIFL